MPRPRAPCAPREIAPETPSRIAAERAPGAVSGFPRPRMRARVGGGGSWCGPPSVRLATPALRFRAGSPGIRGTAESRPRKQLPARLARAPPRARVAGSMAPWAGALGGWFGRSLFGLREPPVTDGSRAGWGARRRGVWWWVLGWAWGSRRTVSVGLGTCVRGAKAIRHRTRRDRTLHGPRGPPEDPRPAPARQEHLARVRSIG